MPYIKGDARDSLESPYVWARGPLDPGELNYLFTQIGLDYIKRSGERYQYYNDVIGALECCKLEMYRRAIAPYEDTKIAENGDVYP